MAAPYARPATESPLSAWCRQIEGDFYVVDSGSIEARVRATRESRPVGFAPSASGLCASVGVELLAWLDNPAAAGVGRHVSAALTKLNELEPHLRLIVELQRRAAAASPAGAKP